MARCLARGNAESGFDVNFHGVAESCVSRDSGKEGFNLARGAAVTESVSYGSYWEGIAMYIDARAGGNLVVDCGMTNYHDEGIAVEPGTGGNYVEANHVALGSNGIKVASSGNIILKNSCVYNDNDAYWEQFGVTNVFGAIEDDVIVYRKPWANFEVEK
jgi:hypothetical protein